MGRKVVLCKDEYSHCLHGLTGEVKERVKYEGVKIHSLWICCKCHAFIKKDENWP